MTSINIAQLLKGRSFLTLATADRDGKPNGAPKFLLKFDKKHIYLIDFSFANTANNLRENPRACLSLMDLDNLQGYRVYGSVDLIENGREHKKIAKELEKRSIELSADRIIRGAQSGKKHEHFELEMPDKFLAIKFKIEEMTRIGTKGDFYRERP